MSTQRLGTIVPVHCHILVKTANVSVINIIHVLESQVEISTRSAEY